MTRNPGDPPRWDSSPLSSVVSGLTLSALGWIPRRGAAARILALTGLLLGWSCLSAVRQTGNEVHLSPDHSFVAGPAAVRVRQVRHAAGDGSLGVVLGDGRALVFGPRPERELRCEVPRLTPFFAIDFSPAGDKACVALFRELGMAVADAKTGEVMYESSGGRAGKTVAVRVAPDGAIAVAATSEALQFVDLHALRVVREVPGRYTAVCFHDDHTVVAGGPDSPLMIIDTKAWSQTIVPRSKLGWINEVESRNGRLAVAYAESDSSGGGVVIFSRSRRSWERRVVLDGEPFGGVKFVTDRIMACSRPLSGKLDFVDLETHQVVGTLDAPEVTRFDVVDGTLIAGGKGAEVWTVALSPVLNH